MKAGVHGAARSAHGEVHSEWQQHHCGKEAWEIVMQLMGGDDSARLQRAGLKCPGPNYPFIPGEETIGILVRKFSQLSDQP